MKVLFVTGRLYPWNFGGVGNVQYHLTRSLSQFNDIDLTVLGTVPVGCRAPDIYPSNVNLIAIQTPGENDSLSDIVLSNLLYPAELSQLGGSHIVHFNIMPGLRSGGLFQLASKTFRRQKFVLNLHDIPEEVGSYSRSWEHSILSKLHYAVSIKQLSSFDAVVVNSSFVRKRYSMICEQARIYTIPNGIVFPLYNFKHSVSRDGEPEILSYGNIAPKKGGEVLIKAFASSHIARKTHTLTFVGRDIGGYSRSLRELAESLGISDRVQILKPMPKNELQKRILGCSFAAFPSAWEGFGISVLEAMSLGKAVVATRNGGPSDFVEDGVDGFLVDPKDMPKLAQLLDNLASDPELRYFTGERASMKAQKYTWDKIAEMYVQLYNNILQH